MVMVLLALVLVKVARGMSKNTSLIISVEIGSSSYGGLNIDRINPLYCNVGLSLLAQFALMTKFT
jgi:hypothetical protein